MNKIKTALLNLLAPVISFEPKNGCVLCGKRTKKYFPVVIDLSAFKGKNDKESLEADATKCPVCGGDAHERLLYLFLKERTSIYTYPSRVLHFAPERMIRKKLEENTRLSYITVELEITEPIDTISIDQKDDLFDIIICNHVLEHVRNDRKTMAELFRALKPGGWAILQEPIAAVLDKTVENVSEAAPEDREKPAGKYDHLRIYGRDYVSRLHEAGFTVTCYNCLDEFGQECVDENKLIAKENIYYCSKPQWRSRNIPEEKA